MIPATTAAVAPLKTPRRIGESVAWASQAFELDAAADYRQPSLRETGWRARGALAIDVPRTCPWASPSSIGPGSLNRAETVERRALLFISAPVAPVRWEVR